MRNQDDDATNAGAKPVLQDILQSPAKQSDVPRPFIDEAVTSLFDQLPAAYAKGDEQIRRFVSETVSTALIARDIPRNKLQLPRMDVVVPALDAVRYSPIKDAFAALIAHSMDSRAAHTVLPAYVEMLKQISEDELLVLRDCPKLGRFTPIADVVYLLPNEQVVVAYRNVLPPAVVNGIGHKDNIPQYIDNLMRLNLLYRPATQEAANASYKSLSRLPFVRDLMKAAPHRAQAGLEKSVIGLSDLGDKFLRACLI
jgi:hypothetical protein